MQPDALRAADTRAWPEKAALDLRSAALDASLEPLLREAAPLTEYAWQFRYPGEVTEPTAEETTASLNVAESVVAAVTDRLPPEARPTP